MKRTYTWVRRLLALALCLILMLPAPAAAAEDDIYIRPLAGGVAQVAMGPDHIAVLRSDGTVAAVGNDDWGQCDVSGWSRVVKIWAARGVTLGLTDSGDLLCSAGTISGWRNIVAVDAQAITTMDMTVVVGLKADGTAVSMGVNARGIVPFNKETCNVTGWKEIIQVLVYEGIYGLKEDGTVVEAGFAGNLPAEIPVGQWTGVKELARTAYGVFGITVDGRVLSQGSFYGCESWTDVVEIIPGGLDCVYGLTSGGRLLSGGEVLVDCGGLSGLTEVAAGVSAVAGMKSDGSIAFCPEPAGMNWNRRESWNDAEELVFDPGFPTVAVLRRDGTVVAASLEDLNEPADCDGWTNVAKLYCEGMVWLAVKEDGTLVSNQPNLDLSPLTSGIRNTRPQELGIDLIAAGLYHSVYVRNDGKVSAAGRSGEGRLDVEDWTDIVGVAAAAHTVGLKANGTVVAVGPNGSGQCEVSGWRDIVDISAGYLNTIGLDAKGTVVVAGGNDYGQLGLTGRRGIVDVAAGGTTVYAVTNKGAVYCAGSDVYGQAQVDDWSGIVAIAAGTSHVVGLRADGTVVAAGLNDEGQCEVSGWTDIVAIAAGSTHTVGLKANGTVVYAGGNTFGQSEVEGWKDVITISAGAYHTLAITASGSILTAGSNEYGQCDVAY